jgi:hypothetical protein
MPHSEIQSKAPRLLKWRRWIAWTKFKLGQLRKNLDQEERDQVRAKFFNYTKNHETK